MWDDDSLEHNGVGVWGEEVPECRKHGDDGRCGQRLGQDVMGVEDPGKDVLDK